MKRLLLTAMTVLLSAGAAWAGPFEDGAAAEKRGDKEEALKQYRLAASQENALAECILGAIYENGPLGWGVTKDQDEALKWYRLAAEHGSAEAPDSIGSMYEKEKKRII